MWWYINGLSSDQPHPIDKGEIYQIANVTPKDIPEDNHIARRNEICKELVKR